MKDAGFSLLLLIAIVIVLVASCVSNSHPVLAQLPTPYIPPTYVYATPTPGSQFPQILLHEIKPDEYTIMRIGSKYVVCKIIEDRITCSEEGVIIIYHVNPEEMHILFHNGNGVLFTEKGYKDFEY